MVGWSELPTAGNELHHVGLEHCSSALCHQGHNGHGQPKEPRYLIVPGLRPTPSAICQPAQGSASGRSGGAARCGRTGLDSWRATTSTRPPP
jgi:56kDa selenium binding protein (SBP56)